MAIVPLNDKIMIKPLPAATKTSGGVLLPDSAQEKSQQGKVASLGDGKRLDNGERAPFQVREGDRVLYRAFAGSEVTCNGKEYLILTEEDILAIVE